MTARWVILLAIAVGCASGRGDNGNGDDSSDAPRDAQTGPTRDGRPPADAPHADAPHADAPTGGGGGLDPDLELPDPSGQVCTQPGRIGAPECPAAEVCRFFTPTEGRCEGGPSGGGNLGAPCTATNQCDILFECYKGQCTNFCTLGSTECGAPADCINIGHATRGVCRI